MADAKTIEKRDVGRPPVITEAIVRKLENSLMDGNTVETACHDAKIGRTTYYDWYNSNDEFANRMNAALDYLEKKSLSVVRKAVEAGDTEMAWRYASRANKRLQGKNTVIQQATQVNVYDQSRSRTSEFVREIEELIAEDQDGAKKTVANGANDGNVRADV